MPEPASLAYAHLRIETLHMDPMLESDHAVDATHSMLALL
jgi:hypothetical protein